MNRLLEIGFEPAGHWALENQELLFELFRHSMQNNILYAFVCDGEIKYVGKTTQKLSKRMYGYKKPASTQSTNINNNQRIKGALSQGMAVDIFALPDRGMMRYGQFHLNLAAALEDDIIKKINPEWNGGVREQQDANTLLENGLDEDKTTFPEPISSFDLKIQPTYFNRGFFNVGVSYENLFGTDGDTIEIFLDINTQPIIGTINRKANLNGTPRIMGGSDLRIWLQENVNVMDDISVSVLSPTSIKIKCHKQQSKQSNITEANYNPFEPTHPDFDSDGLMVPPWIKYPNIPLGSIGWRMGSGEDFWRCFIEWWKLQPTNVQSQVKIKYPPHNEWGDDFYDTP